MYCRHCGYPLTPNGAFCRACGQPVTVPTPPKPLSKKEFLTTSKDEKLRKQMRLLYLVFGLAAGLLILTFFGSGNVFSAFMNSISYIEAGVLQDAESPVDATVTFVFLQMFFVYAGAFLFAFVCSLLLYAFLLPCALVTKSSAVAITMTIMTGVGGTGVLFIADVLRSTVSLPHKVNVFLSITCWALFLLFVTLVWFSVILSKINRAYRNYITNQYYAFYPRR